MAIFELKSDLPLKTQEKIDYLEAIDSAKRTTAQAAFLTALTPYLTNAVLSVDASGNIVAASGLTVPTGYSGFAKNATFVKTDATTNGLYTNTGTTSVAAWDLVDQASTSNIDDGAITSAKLADSISFDGKTLVLDEAIPVNAVASSSLLTVAAQPSEADTVSLGGKTYKFRAVIGEGVAATGTITTDETLVANTATVVIGDVTYTFKTALNTEPTVAYEVLIGANYTDMLNNLAAAINGAAGEGTTYSTGTVAHPLVTAGAVNNGAFTVTAKSVGFAGNIDSTSSDAHLFWGASTLIGGIDAAVANDVLIGISAETAIDNLVLAITAGAGAGASYATGTTVNALATAVKASAATMTATNKIKGVIGDDTAIAASGADLSWAKDATKLSGGVNGTVGVKNQIVVDATNVYMCTATNTIADANWKKLILQSL